MDLSYLPCSWITAKIPDTNNMLPADAKLVSLILGIFQILYISDELHRHPDMTIYEVSVMCL